MMKRPMRKAERIFIRQAKTYHESTKVGRHERRGGRVFVKIPCLSFVCSDFVFMDWQMVEGRSLEEREERCGNELATDNGLRTTDNNFMLFPPAETCPVRGGRRSRRPGRGPQVSSCAQHLKPETTRDSLNRGVRSDQWSRE